MFLQQQSRDTHNNLDALGKRLNELKRDFDQVLAQAGITREEIHTLREHLGKLDPRERALVDREMQAFKEELESIECTFQSAEETSLRRTQLRDASSWIAL